MSFVIIAHDDDRISHPIALLSEDNLEVADRWVTQNYRSFPKSFNRLTVYKFVGRRPELAWHINLRPDDGFVVPRWREAHNVLPPDYPWVSPT